MSTNSFLAGVAKVDITPPPGTFIDGDFVAHYARFIHDPLFAKAFVMQHGAVRVAMLVIDICVLPKEYVDGVKLEITRQTGIGFEHIMISCTHTHAAGSVASVYLSAADIQYMKKLPELIVRAVLLAVQNIRPAKVAFGAVDIPEHVLCRRYKMKSGYTPLNPVSGGADQVKTNPFGDEQSIFESTGIPDPQASFIAVRGMDDSWISMFANYSLHYVGDWENGTISADYFGEFSKRIREKLNADDDFIGIMSNGTSGDVNIWDFRNPDRYPKGNFKKSRYIGNDIAEKIHGSLKEIEWNEHPEIEIHYEELTIPVRKPSIEELEKAKKIISETDFSKLELNEEGLHSIYAREQVLLNEFPDELLFPIQAIRVGENVIGALGGEIFAETGLWLKEKSGVKNYFTIGLANGNLGYVPPAHEMEKGGYETWRSRTSKLDARAEAMIKNKLLQLINEFKPA